MNIIEIKNLTKVYQKRYSKKKITALNNVNLEIPQGIIFGLLGPNGAGKTTLIKILLEIAFPTSGQTKMFNSDENRTELKKFTGYLPENHKYPSYLTGEAVLRIFGQLGGCDHKNIKARVSYVLDLVDMKNWADTKIKKYSKGMMQRLGLAQALMNDPKLIFLDEPTDGIDPIGRSEIREILKNLKSEGKTIFLNSHLLSEVEMISDRAAILNKGELVWDGAVSDLTENSKIVKISTDQMMGDSVLQEIQKKYDIKKCSQNCISIALSEIKDVNFAIDELRKNNIDIISVIPEKQSLEEMFISLIKNAETEIK